MKLDDAVSRVSIKKNKEKVRGTRKLKQAVNPAKLDTYVDIHPKLPLRQVQTIDGGTSYRRSITRRKFEEGDRIPASLKIAGDGFIDARW